MLLWCRSSVSSLGQAGQGQTVLPHCSQLGSSQQADCWQSWAAEKKTEAVTLPSSWVRCIETLLLSVIHVCHISLCDYTTFEYISTMMGGSSINLLVMVIYWLLYWLAVKFVNEFADILDRTSRYLSVLIICNLNLHLSRAENSRFVVKLFESIHQSKSKRIPVEFDLSGCLQSRCQQCVPAGNKTGANHTVL